jgi:phenylalanyl-tRNA synthetase beta chain
MKVSYNWLQTHIEEPLPSVEDLKETIIFKAFEVEESQKVGDDTVFEIKVLPDRAGDCLSHQGIAREIAGLLNLTYKKEEPGPELSGELTFPVEIQSDTCVRYSLVELDGVTVGKSPEWLKARLESLGQRSINNIVDATNFLMLDSGQPIHAFDRKKIDGGIIVRAAKEHESIITLSEEQKTLQPTDTVIADYVGAIAIAGVKGGKTAEVDASTTSIVIEIANFSSSHIRKTSRKLGLITDASKRFENNFSPASIDTVRGAITALIQSVAGGTIVGMCDYYPNKIQERVLTFSTSDITRLLGRTITTNDITRVFDQYKYAYTVDGETFTLTIPFWRTDLIGAHDIAEEVGRVIGYDRIPVSVLPFTPMPERNDTYEKIRTAKAYLCAQGFSEVMTYSFRKKGEVYVAYGAKDKSALRTNLSEALQESFELNRLNAALLGQKMVKLFEIGTVFTTTEEKIHVASIDNGTIQELALDEWFIAHPDAIGYISEQKEISSEPFKMWSPYPFITRDVSVWVQDEDGRKKLDTLIKEFAKEFCVRDAYMIDEFTKENRTSIAYRLVFQS